MMLIVKQSFATWPMNPGETAGFSMTMYVCYIHVLYFIVESNLSLQNLKGASLI